MSCVTSKEFKIPNVKVIMVVKYLCQTPTSLATKHYISFMQFSTTRTKQIDKNIIERNKHSESRIHDLNFQKHEPLESVYFMTSQPQCKHSYEKDNFIKTR